MLETVKAQGWGDDSINKVFARQGQAGPGHLFPGLRGSLYTVLRNISFPRRESRELLMTENSRCCPSAVCRADSHFLKEVLHLLCGSQCDTVGFASLLGKVCPHLHSAKGRWGEQSLCVVWEPGDEFSWWLFQWSTVSYACHWFACLVVTQTWRLKSVCCSLRLFS